MPSNHLVLWHPLLLLPSIFPSIRVFSNAWALRIKGPKNWSFSFSISPSNEYSELISFRIDLGRYTLLYLKWITNRDPWYSTRNCAQWQPGWGRMDTCICMGETLHGSCETTTTLLIGYTPTQNKKFKKKNSITTDFLRTSCYFQSSSKPLLEGGTTKYFKVKNI